MKMTERIENTVRKEEIAHEEQFLLFPQYFERLVLQPRENKGLFGKRVNQVTSVCEIIGKLKFIGIKIHVYWHVLNDTQPLIFLLNDSFL